MGLSQILFKSFDASVRVPPRIFNRNRVKLPPIKRDTVGAQYSSPGRVLGGSRGFHSDSFAALQAVLLFSQTFRHCSFKYLIILSLMRDEDGGRRQALVPPQRLVRRTFVSHACVFSAQIFAKEELNVSLSIGLLPLFWSPSR